MNAITHRVVKRIFISSPDFEAPRQKRISSQSSQIRSGIDPVSIGLWSDCQKRGLTRLYAWAFSPGDSRKRIDAPGGPLTVQCARPFTWPLSVSQPG